MQKKVRFKGLLLSAALAALAVIGPLVTASSATASHEEAKDALLNHVRKITSDRVRLSQVSLDLRNAKDIKSSLTRELNPLLEDMQVAQEVSADMAVDLYILGDTHVASGLLAASSDPLSLVSNMVLLEPVGLQRNRDNAGLVSQSNSLSEKIREMDTLIPILSAELKSLLSAESKNSRKLDALAKATVREPGDAPLLGNPQLSAEVLAWYAERVSPKWIMPVSRLQLASWYIEEGRAESVRGDMAFLQAARETGWFKFEDSKVSITQNNFAGIGACDSCKQGESFPSVQEGVRAHIQMVRTYADPEYSSSSTARPPIGRIDTNPVRGCCNTWYELGRYWASAPEYGKRVVRMHNAVVYTYKHEK